MVSGGVFSIKRDGIMAVSQCLSPLKFDLQPREPRSLDNWKMSSKFDVGRFVLGGSIRSENQVANDPLEPQRGMGRRHH